MKVAGWGLLASLFAMCACAAPPAQPPPPAQSPPPPSSAAAPTTSPSGDASFNQDPARFAPQVIKYAREAGVDAQLVMAILYNESYKPHDPSVERAWQRTKPDAAFGVANMHKPTFDETKQGRPFAGRDWQELPDDPGLAIEAEAWYLHDLATGLPSSHPAYTTDELLALGYNAGPSNMKAFAHGTKPGPIAESYLDGLHQNWDKAAQALQHA